MKKVIKGRVYCTDTAKELGWWSNTSNRRDFAWACETLYKTKSGQYFLHCEGGPMSRYGWQFGNEGGYGEKIEVLSIDQAKTWAEEKLSGDEYEEIFGVIEEDEGERVTVSVDANVKQRLDELQSKTGKSLSDVIAMLLDNQK